MFDLQREAGCVLLLPVFMLSYVHHVLTPGLYLKHRHEIGISRLISLPGSRQICIFSKGAISLRSANLMWKYKTLLLMHKDVIGLRGIKVLWYTRVFRNPKGMIFNTVKIINAPLSIKLILRRCIDVIYCSAQHVQQEVSLDWGKHYRTSTIEKCLWPCLGVFWV